MGDVINGKEIHDGDLAEAMRFVRSLETSFTKTEGAKTRIEILKAFCAERVETTRRQNQKSSYKSKPEIPVSTVAKIFGWDFGEMDEDE